MELAVVCVVIVVALAFDYTNGFHDAANAIATSASTRALAPRTALLMAAVMNLVGAFLGTEVATTVGSGIIAAPQGIPGLLVVLSALLGAIAWNLVTWYYGLPSSSSHALIGGLVGAALASSGQVRWDGVLNKVIVPMVLSPIVGFVLAALVMIGLLWVFRRGRPSRLTRGFRHAQTVTAAAMALGHGLQDAQKTMGVIVLALVVGGYHQGFDVPWWVILLAAGALSAGTYSGGWRIMRTLGRRIIDLDPPRGLAAEATASACAGRRCRRQGRVRSGCRAVGSGFGEDAPRGDRRSLRCFSAGEPSDAPAQGVRQARPSPLGGSCAERWPPRVIRPSSRSAHCGTPVPAARREAGRCCRVQKYASGVVAATWFSRCRSGRVGGCGSCCSARCSTG